MQRAGVQQARGAGGKTLELTRVGAPCNAPYQLLRGAGGFGAQEMPRDLQVDGDAIPRVRWQARCGVRCTPLRAAGEPRSGDERDATIAFAVARGKQRAQGEPFGRFGVAGEQCELRTDVRIRSHRAFVNIVDPSETRVGIEPAARRKRACRRSRSQPREISGNRAHLQRAAAIARSRKRLAFAAERPEVHVR